LKIRDSIDSLLRNPNARSWGGKLFERAVHRAFREGIELEPEAMDDDAPPLRIQIKKVESEAGGYFHMLSVRASPGSRNVGEEFLNQYLIPLSSTAETIDSVNILKDVTVLFQMTVSPFHSLNLKGITELTNELPANAKKRICIVFVVPDYETTRKPYKRQNIVIPDGVPKHVSDPVVAYKQYVYYFPMDKLRLVFILLHQKFCSRRMQAVGPRPPVASYYHHHSLRVLAQHLVEAYASIFHEGWIWSGGLHSSMYLPSMLMSEAKILTTELSCGGICSRCTF
jgi:hypothetical protein